MCSKRPEAPSHPHNGIGTPDVIMGTPNRLPVWGLGGRSLLWAQVQDTGALDAVISDLVRSL